MRNIDEAFDAVEGMRWVFALAADMGGMGFISQHHAEIMTNNIGINLNTLRAADYWNRIAPCEFGEDENGNLRKGIDRYLFTSSACVYPEFLQDHTDSRSLKETDAYPAQPQDAYGWEKLVTEQLCTHYRNDFRLLTKVVRFHNIFGPMGTWKGGREKAPAALCRKVAMAKILGETWIEIWGDGKQTRSFCYVDDCVEGLYKFMLSDYTGPLNLGQDRMVTIDELAKMIMEIAGVDLEIRHIHGPQGVRGRNSDNTMLKMLLNWEPRISLEEGLKRTYTWIEEQVKYWLEDLDRSRQAEDKKREV